VRCVLPHDHEVDEAAGSGEVVPVFVQDPRLMGPAGVRRDRLTGSLLALRAETGGALVIRSGDPAEVIARLAAEVDADEVHIAAETTPYGRRRDEVVARRLAEQGCRLVATGSPYAVTPGRVLTGEENQAKAAWSTVACGLRSGP
jgi:deoxyribodipyrimidine photo-lyase